MLIIFEKQDKFHTVESIDDVVSAEIPSPITHPRLYKLVTSHMIHGPCGVEDPASPCMKDGKCGANFPKEFCPTLLNVDGFPRYRRRELPLVPIKRKSKTEPFNFQEFQLDNRNLVPYNKNLLLIFNAHINVEICTSVKSVKYIYKHIFKGIFKNVLFIRMYSFILYLLCSILQDSIVPTWKSSTTNWCMTKSCNISTHDTSALLKQCGDCFHLRCTNIRIRSNDLPYICRWNNTSST